MPASPARRLTHGSAITRAQFTRLLSAMGRARPAADAAFDALDHDRDGRITRDQCVTAWEDYLFGDNRDTIGARMFAGL